MATAPSSTTNLPSAFSLFGPSMEALLFNLKTFVLLGLVPGLLGVATAAISVLTEYYGRDVVPDAVAIPMMVALLVVSLVTMPALTYMQLRSAQRRRVGVNEALRQGLHFFWRLLGLNLCLGVVFVIAIILLVVPFFFMLRRYILSPFYLVGHDVGIFEAMRLSAADSKKYSKAVWGLIGVQILIGLSGIVPLIGVLASMVLNLVFYCAPAVRYYQISKLSKGKRVIEATAS